VEEVELIVMRCACSVILEEVLLCAFALERLRTRCVYDPRLPDYPPACLALICLRIHPSVLDPASGLR